uniref:Uncharacterized protein n=1 Tax=Scophthalmus maximus TaxID=52904 RepID=A0A8D2ZFH2_SCOMX
NSEAYFGQGTKVTVLGK